MGAGGGSIAAWLGRIVGDSGRVVATDLHPEQIEANQGANIDIRRYDVRTDESPGNEFDLAYARLVVDYVGIEAIPRMTKALRSGGILLLEDYDWASVASWPPAPAFTRVMSLVVKLMISSGLDPHFGRLVAAALRGAGLDDVASTTNSRTIVGGSLESGLLGRVVEISSRTLIANGAVEPSGVDAALGELADPGRTFVLPTLIATWGTYRDRTP